MAHHLKQFMSASTTQRPLAMAVESRDGNQCDMIGGGCWADQSLGDPLSVREVRFMGVPEVVTL